MNTGPSDSEVRLLPAYLHSVSPSESLQANIWHEAELTLVQLRALRRLAKRAQTMGQIGKPQTGAGVPFPSRGSPRRALPDSPTSGHGWRRPQAKSVAPRKRSAKGV